jgi:hypothetical protein
VLGFRPAKREAVNSILGSRDYRQMNDLSRSLKVNCIKPTDETMLNLSNDVNVFP